MRKASPSTDREPASAKSQGGTSAGSSATIWLQNLPSPEEGSPPQAAQRAQPAGWAVLRHAHEAQVLADAQTNEEKWSALAKPWLRKYDTARIHNVRGQWKIQLVVHGILTALLSKAAFA